MLSGAQTRKAFRIRQELAELATHQHHRRPFSLTNGLQRQQTLTTRLVIRSLVGVMVQRYFLPTQDTQPLVL
jgi:hypothetical protein